MDNKDNYKEYIQDTVITPIERLMGKRVEEVDGWRKYGSRGLTPKKDAMYKSTLHTMMLPYYEMYLHGDTRLCKPNMENIRLRMKRVIDDDDQFGRWASEQDLIAAAEGWGDNMKRISEDKRIFQYFHLLEALQQTGCCKDWEALSKELKEMLFKAEVYSDYKTDEVLCVLHAFTMIMQTDWTAEKKAENLELLRRQWLFMKHYYSVMTRHIVGVKWTQFSDVTKTVMEASQSFKPHLHIFYSGLMDCVDELPLDRKQRRQMDKLILRLEEEMNRHEPSDMLYELCDTLFPEDFQRLLREHRAKSYKEVEDESHRKDELITQMQKQNIQLKNDLDKAKEVLQQMIVSAIPIKDIDKELEQYPPAMAWELLTQLNASPVLSAIDAWHNSYPSLLKKHRERLNNSMNQQKAQTEAIIAGVNRPTYHYEPGAVHDDKRNQLMLGEENEKYVPLKRLSNE